MKAGGGGPEHDGCARWVECAMNKDFILVVGPVTCGAGTRAGGVAHHPVAKSVASAMQVHRFRLNRTEQNRTETELYRFIGSYSNIPGYSYI